MYLSTIIAFLVLSASVVDVQGSDSVLQTLANGPGSIIKAADPFNCEFSQADYAISALTDSLKELTNNPATSLQGTLKTLITYVIRFVSWPLCWLAELGRVANSTTQLASNASSTLHPLIYQPLIRAMFSTVTVLALLVCASVLHAQSNPIADVTNAATTLVNAAQPGNCEVTQANNAVIAAQNFVSAAQQYLSNPAAASQSVINNIFFYAGQLLSWPNCWYSEAGRVQEAANGLLQSGLSG